MAALFRSHGALRTVEPAAEDDSAFRAALRVGALAQLAPDGAVLVCAEAFARLVAPERLRLAAFDNPAAAALATEATPHCLALGLETR